MPRDVTSAMSSAVTIEQQIELIRSIHQCAARFVEAVTIVEHGPTGLSEQVVHVFDLAGHPRASRCYVCFVRQAGQQAVFVPILHEGRVVGPRSAYQDALRKTSDQAT
jgi:hypothetical protein